MTQGIFVGLSTIDVVYGVDGFPKTNSKVAAHSQDVYVGGPATNAGITFAHLGGQASLVTAVGRHPLSRMVRDELQKCSVQLVDLSPKFDEVPSIASVCIDRKGNRNVVSAGALQFDSPGAEVAFDPAVCRGARIVLVDGHYMPACQAWAKGARGQNTPVVLDGGSWKEGTAELLKYVQTAICSADFRPPGCATKDAVIRLLKDSGVTNVAITDGAQPIHFASGASSGTLRVPEVEVVDTMGAGDVFHGAYCYFAAVGHGFVEALAEAAEIATESCRYNGTRAWASARLAPELAAKAGSMRASA
jgi:sugar/nucleoside kinase (ribokinase family)